MLVDDRDRIVGATASAEALLDAVGGLVGESMKAETIDRDATIGVEGLGGLSMPTLGPLQAFRLRPADETAGDAVAILAHDMKTPLTAIVGALKLIEGGAIDRAADEAKSLIAMALRNAERMDARIGEILETEVAAAVGLTMRETDLALAVERAVDTCRAFSMPRNVDLLVRIAERPALALDAAGDLERAIENLISNAVKSSDPGGTVEVSLDQVERGWCITVGDTGPGIPPSFQPMIFRRFARLDVEDGRNQGGAGLGLAIARDIVEAHSGRIGFASQAGDTRFWIEIPIARENDTE